MSDAAENATETPKTPAERLREKLTTLRGNRVGAVARTQKKAAATTVERLLTPEERRKMKKKTRKTQKNNIERLLKQSGITDVPTRNKVFAGIQNGTIGSEAELKRFLEQEKAKSVVVTETPLTGFSMAGLRRPDGSLNSSG